MLDTKCVLSLGTILFWHLPYQQVPILKYSSKDEDWLYNIKIFTQRKTNIVNWFVISRLEKLLKHSQDTVLINTTDIV